MKALCLLGLAVLSALPALACNGVQARPATGPPDAARSLHLVLRVSEKGATEVTSAAEVPGAAILPDAVTGDYLWLVSRDGRAFVAGSSPDPFATRGYAPPGSPSEQQNRQESGSIVVRVPGLGLDSALESLAIDLYRLRPAPDGSGISQVNPETVERLRKEGRLERLAGLSGADFAAQIRRVGRKAAP